MNEPNPIRDLAAKIEDADTKADLRGLITAHPEVRKLYLAAAVRCLDARKFYFDREENTYKFEADGPTVLRAAVFLASYDAGLPIQTSVNLNLGGDKGPTLEEATANSPALVAALEKALEQARKKQAKQIKQAEKVS